MLRMEKALPLLGDGPPSRKWSQKQWAHLGIWISRRLSQRPFAEKSASSAIVSRSAQTSPATMEINVRFRLKAVVRVRG